MAKIIQIYGLFGFKLQTEKELEENRKRGDGGTVHFMHELPEYIEISDKYNEEQRRLEEYRKSCKDEAFDMLKQYFLTCGINRISEEYERASVVEVIIGSKCFY